MRRIPANLITGFLGVGKTTAILDALTKRERGERWAIVVNEVGRVGIDGAVMDDAADGDLVVREIPGGCICCTSGPLFQVHLVRIMREIKPDRLVVEPTGLAHPAALLDTMRRPGLGLDCKAVITLVDPVKFVHPKWSEHETYADQVRLADILVANQCDRASEAQIARFREVANQADPPKRVVATTQHGVLDPAWLDMDAGPSRVTRVPSLRESASQVELRSGEPLALNAPMRLPDEVEGAYTCGWVFPPKWVFDRQRLELVLQELVRPNPALPNGVLRLKGVFHTPGLWLHVNASDEEIRWRALNHRRDSRVEIIVEVQPDWDAVEERLRSARWQRPA